MSQFLSSVTKLHLNSLHEFYNQASTEPGWIAKSHRRLLAHYYNSFIPHDASVLEIGCGSGYLLSLLKTKNISGIDLSSKQLEAAKERIPNAKFYLQAGEELELPDQHFDYIIISDTLNLSADVQQLFSRLKLVSHPQTRLIFNIHSALWRPILSVATFLKLKRPQPQSSWLGTNDIINLLNLSDWELIKKQSRLLVPISIFGIERLINQYISPLIPFANLTLFGVARPRLTTRSIHAPTVSVVVPARNESGNIQAAIERTPDMGSGTELIFVEGNSTDDTWEKIQTVVKQYPHKNIKILQQTGKGKGNAVREGFAVATGDILMILDADLTMPPEELPKFYDVIASNHAEFANGVRLVYPMDKEAMQFLNLCANKAFGILFTWLLDQPIKDTLCGTKVLSRSHYNQLAANRSYFGEFDPFGDFDLLFGADKLNLKFADIPIRYRERSYGSTNIQRWRHGVLLLRMVLFAAKKLKFI